MKKLKVKSVGMNERVIRLKFGMNKYAARKNVILFKMRALGMWHSERDLAVMILILGNRHLAPQAHFSPAPTYRSKTLKRVIHS